MRPRYTLVALLVTIALALAGCLEVSDGSGDEEPQSGNGDGGEPTDSTGTQDPPGQDTEEPSNGGSSNDDDELPEDAECHEHSPPKTPHPDEREVDSVQDIRCRGQYAVLDAGTGETWNVPQWSTGDWWVYQTETQGHCSQVNETVVDDSQSVVNLSVYGVQLQRYEECGGEPYGSTSLDNRTQQSLRSINDDGYIPMDILFPLKEDKAWIMGGNCSDTDCPLIEVDEISYIPEYSTGLIGGENLEVWYIELTLEGSASPITFKQWWSVHYKNLLKEEMHLDDPPPGFTNPLNTKSLVDSSYYEEDDDLLPLPLPRP